MRDSIRRFLNKLQDFFPTIVPQGRTEFNNLAERIIFTYQPKCSPGDVSWLLATHLQRIGPFCGYYPNFLFSLVLKRAAGGQTGAMLMYEMKEAQKAEAAKQAEVTATPATNGTQVQNA